MLDKVENRAHLARLLLDIENEIGELAEIVGPEAVTRLDGLRYAVIEFVAEEMKCIVDKAGVCD